MSTPAEQQKAIARGLREFEISRALGMTLEREYPGYNWHVEACEQAGVVRVRNLSLNGDWGWIAKLHAVVHDLDFRACKAAAGEILERYNCRRGKMDTAEVGSQQRDLRGNAIGDHS